MAIPLPQIFSDSLRVLAADFEIGVEMVLRMGTSLAPGSLWESGLGAMCGFVLWVFYVAQTGDEKMKLSAILTGLVACLCTAAANADLSGAYEAQNWSSTGIRDGTTSVTPSSGFTDTIAFGYDVDLGNPGNGVSFRTTTFSVVADRTGTVTFDYDYSGFHAFVNTNVYFEVFAETSSGTTSMVIVNEPNSGGFAYNGSITIDVEAGMSFGIVVGGGNFDSNSVINGTVTLSNFQHPMALRNAYAMENWSTTGIADGTTAITPDTGETSVASFSYDVDLGNPGDGVPFRTTTFSVPAGTTGTVTFDYDYNGFHSFFLANVYLEVFAETSNGRNSVVLVNQEDGGGFSYSGTVSIDVEKGMPFGIIVGGGNLDSNSVINGQVDIRNFRPALGFDNELRLENWNNSGIAEGTTSIDPISGAIDKAGFSYDVDLGNPGNGVLFRTTQWDINSNKTGMASFNWHYTGFHAFYLNSAYLEFFSQTSNGTHSVVVVNGPVSAAFDLSGSIQIPVEAGMPFGIVVGGSNHDSNSVINGTVAIDTLSIDFCPADFNHDNTINTQDVLAFLNAFTSNDPNADFNGDGTVDTQDVLAFLNAWTSGC